MALFPWTDAVKEAKRLEQRSIDFDQLQDQTEWNRDRVTRVRRSVCPSPEKPPEVVDGTKPACSMSGFVAINRPEQKTNGQTATTLPKQEEVAERVPRTSEPTLEHKNKPASATFSTKEQSNASSSKEDPNGKSQERGETEQDEQTQNAEKRLSQPAITLAQFLAFQGPGEDNESDEESIPRLRTRRPRDRHEDGSADATSDGDEARAPKRRLRRSQRLPSPRPTPSPSPAPTCTPRVQLEDRDWTVLGITAAQKEHDITKYKTIWGNTSHPLPTLQANAEGIYEIEVDGRVCVIEEIDEPLVLGDDTPRQVRWKHEWLYTWELSDARKAVVSFNLQRGEGPVIDPDHLPTYRSPEPEANATERCRLNFSSDQPFTIEANGDYTASLMWRCVERCEQGINHDRLRLSFMRECLDELPRQRLVLRSRWRLDQLRDDYSDELDLREEMLLHHFLNYVVGQARRSPCSHCSAHCGPFRKCVTRGSRYNGACTSCALAGRGLKCEYYLPESWAKEDEMRQAIADQAGQDALSPSGNEATSLDEELHSLPPFCPSSPPCAFGAEQLSGKSTFPTPPISSSPLRNADHATSEENADTGSIDTNMLVDDLVAHVDSLQDNQFEQEEAPREKSQATEKSQSSTLFSQAASAAGLNRPFLVNDAASSETHDFQSISKLFKRAKEYEQEVQPDTQNRAGKRKRSSSSPDLPRRVQPNRQHKAVRTIEGAETSFERAFLNLEDRPPGDPSELQSNDTVKEAMAAGPETVGNNLKCFSRPDIAPQAIPVRSAASLNPPARSETSNSATRPAESAAEQGHDLDLQEQPVPQQPPHQTEHQPHADCSPRGPCIDPILNPLPPKTDPESPVVIYRDRDQLFKKSELTDAEVRYLLSIAPCNIINAVTQFWQEVEPEVKKHNCVGKRTKEWYLSDLWTHELNQIVRERCPPDPSRLGRPVVIDLTLDDD